MNQTGYRLNRGWWRWLASLAILMLLATTSSYAASFAIVNQRGGNSAVIVRSSYDYAPTIMRDGVYKMWWCAGVAGDYILYSEASAPGGPWTAPRSVFQPSGPSNPFDGTHTCDPSVIRVNGTYYMYYGGITEGIGLQPTRIGVATSQNGINWTRLNGGQPIIGPQVSNVSIYLNNGNPCDDGRVYGAGQPSALHLNGYFYLIYTDTTGNASNACNGAGQYVIRSQDPTFQSGVEVQTAAGFAPRTTTNQTSYSVLESFSIDWVYSDVLDQFIIASDNVANVIMIHLYNQSLTRTESYQIPAQWNEGPGIAHRPDGHALPSPGLSRVPLDIMRAVGTSDVNSWNLAYVGADLETFYTLDQLKIGNKVGRTLEGFRLETSGLPMTLVRDGRRLQFALAAPALRLSRNVYAPSSTVFHAVPYAASMPAGAQVVGATGRPAAFVLDGQLKWPVSCLEVITDNQSQITSIPLSQYDAMGTASSLYCLR